MSSKKREQRAMDALIVLAFLGYTGPLPYEVVRIATDCEIDGYSLRAGMVGTIVSVYGDGKAFAVEFPDLERGGAVVTLRRGHFEYP